MRKKEKANLVSATEMAPRAGNLKQGNDMTKRAYLTPEHDARKGAADNPDVLAAYRYVEGRRETADLMVSGAPAWYGWAISEAFLAGCTYSETTARMEARRLFEAGDATWPRSLMVRELRAQAQSQLHPDFSRFMGMVADELERHDINDAVAEEAFNNACAVRDANGREQQCMEAVKVAYGLLWRQKINVATQCGRLSNEARKILRDQLTPEECSAGIEAALRRV